MEIIKNPVIKACIFILGVIAVVLGVIGIFLPVLPTTPFILLAAWCFLRSSKRAHDWIYQQPLFGEALVDWEKNRSIKKSTKVLAITMISISIISIWLKVPNPWIKFPVIGLLLFVSVFIVTRKSGEA